MMSGRKKKSIQIGTRFGGLVVIGDAPSRSRSACFMCRCDCGVVKSINGGSLRRGDSTSCGCSAKSNPHNFTHRMSKTAEHRAWVRMKERCNYKPGRKAYHLYAGKGVTVCERWIHSFENFYSDVGPSPGKGYSIDRWPNNDGNYEPGNVRWATAEQQANNMRVNRLLTANGETHTMAEWSRISGIDPSAISGRLRLGWDEQRAVTEPSNKTAGRFVSTKMLTFEGETLSMNDWARKKGFPLHTVAQRIRSGWSTIDALTIPVQKQFSHASAGRKSAAAPQDSNEW